MSSGATSTSVSTVTFERPAGYAPTHDFARRDPGPSDLARTTLRLKLAGITSQARSHQDDVIRLRRLLLPEEVVEQLTGRSIPSEVR